MRSHRIFIKNCGPASTLKFAQTFALVSRAVGTLESVRESRGCIGGTSRCNGSRTECSNNCARQAEADWRSRLTRRPRLGKKRGAESELSTGNFEHCGL